VAIDVIERPSRWRFTYAFELVAIDGTGRGANRVFNFPINPEHIHVTAVPGAEATYTAGGVVLEESGFVVHDVVIGGTTGIELKRGWKLEKADPHKPETGLTFRDGNELFKQLVRWFEFYWSLKRNQEVAAKWCMVFHDFRLGRHWLILPQGFDDHRNAREHRLHYPYEIRFRAVADYDALQLEGVMAALAAVRDFGDTINNVILDVAGYVADAEALVAEVDSAIVGSLQRSIAAVRAVVDGLAGVAAGVRNMANIKRRLAVDAQRVIGGVRADLLGSSDDGGTNQAEAWEPGNRTASVAMGGRASARRAEAAMDTILAERDLWQPSLTDSHTTRDANAQGDAALSDAEVATDAPSHVGLDARVTPGSRFRRALQAARPSRRAYSGVREYVVCQGDTIRGLAVDEVGDGEAWFDIAELNGLRAPYFSPTGMPNTARPGDRIWLPTLGAEGNATAGPQQDREKIEEMALGVDFELGDNGDLVLNSARTGYRLVRGMDCYVQGLQRVRFATKLGENPVYPSVGILAPIGEQSGAGMVAAIALSVRRACFTDPRTQDVVDLEVRDEGDGAFVEVEVMPRALVGPVLVRRGIE